MNRRMLLAGLAGLSVGSAAGVAKADASAFEALLARVQADPENLVEKAWSQREREQERSGARAVGLGLPSKRPISERAMDMIVTLEVSSRQRYERRYRRPVWPGGLSGVTIGIGYDLRFATESLLQRDWGALLDAQMIAALKPALGVGREAARDLTPTLHAVDVPWDAAISQYRAFIPFPIAQTELVFPNCQNLNDDSLGALVSLVYNRGAGLRADDDRRREMREIRDFMVSGNYAAVPAKIREMKRLWSFEAQPGLHIRRDLEAALFELGLESGTAPVSPATSP